MRKIIICTFLFAMSCQTFGQEAHDKAYYLAKSKNQKTTAWVFLIGGVVTAGVAAAVSASNICFGCPQPTGPEAGEIIAIVGGVITVSSIPFFIASAKNKKKANNLSAFLKLEPNSFAMPAGFTRRSFPALSMVLSL